MYHHSVRWLCTHDEQSKGAKPMATDMWQLRRQVIQHPIHQRAMDPVDRTTVLVHKAIERWCSAHLGSALEFAGTERHLDDAHGALRQRGAGRCLDCFLAAVQTGTAPIAAAADAGLPPAARPLIEAVCQIAAGRSKAARLCAFADGLPCCRHHQALALGGLAGLGAETEADADADADAAAAAAARRVLEGRVALYDGAMETIRQRKMTFHPSAWRLQARVPSPIAQLRSTG